MKRSILALALLCSVTGVAFALAEEQAVPADPVEAITVDREAATPETPGMPRMMHGKGMMHGGDQHGKGQGGMMHGGGRHGKQGEDKHRQVLQRLDMIEARMAKIEAMLEILVRR
jgi:hypothetical protein